MLEVRLLGKFEVRLDGITVDLPSRAEQSLLAYLILNAGTAYRREKLVGMFWPESDESNSRGYLRLAIWHIRKVFREASVQSPDFFVSNKISIAFNNELDYWLDVAVLKNEDLKSIQDLMDLTGVYKGELLPGFYDPWVAIERESIRTVFKRKMNILVEKLLAEKYWQEAIEETERWISLDDIPEPAYRGLMIAHAELGELSAAVAAYQRCVEALKEDLDVEPSVETRTLYEKIRSGQEIFPVMASQSIRGFELVARLGEGMYGAVYHAIQKSIGREVAVKVIHSQYVNDPDFIRSFDVEAQKISYLEHAHIVPLYDYWREPDGAYLVTRLFKGGSLKTLLESGPLETRQALEIVDQIAAGLVLAHRQGVVHRHIKPTNILLDESGNAYLSDFGITKVPEGHGYQTLAGGLSGAYTCISPEQIRNQPVTALSDIYSLGIVLYQMLTGKSPFPDEEQIVLSEKHLSQPLPSLRSQRPDLPREIDDVIQRATAKDPTNRFSDVLALTAAFRQALSVPSESALIGLAPATGVVNPYKGLRAFQEADAADFFGREELTKRLVSRLGDTDSQSRFLAVVGPSGSGKSSLVKAGLIPALRRGTLPGSEKWFILEMFPGYNPFEELEVSLMRIVSRRSIHLMEPLRRDERGILRAARLALPSDESKMLLVIDQFEELFTLTEDRGEARRFMEGLYVAVTEPRSPLRLVITLRADFFDRPLMDNYLSELLQDCTEVVVPLSASELERAIRSPAQRVGLEVEPALVTAIIADVIEQPGALPLLQYALTELFEHREGHRLTLDSYQAVGGVEGVLGLRAEGVYAKLSANGKSAARQSFLRLVTLGKGVEDTRRRVLRSELESVAIESYPFSSNLDTKRDVSSSAIAEVINDFGSARLLSFNRDAATRSPTVEIAHEALLSEWQRLRGWLDEGREDVSMQRLLGNAAAEWGKAGCDTSFLLHGTRLSHFESWVTETDLALTAEEHAFIDASLSERDAQLAEEAARKRREAALEQRARNVLRALVVVLLLITLGSLSLAWTTRRNSNLSTSRNLADAAINNLETDPEFSIMLSVQALRAAYTRQAEDALHRALMASRVRLSLTGHTHGARYVDFSPDGKSLATTSNAGEVTVWETDSGRKLFSLPGSVARYSPNGARLATGGQDGMITIWNIITRERLLTLKGPTNNKIYNINFSPDGKFLVSNSEDNTFLVWDTQTGKEMFLSNPVQSMFDALYSVNFSPTSRLLISSVITRSGSEISFFEVDHDWVLLNQQQTGGYLTFSPNGRWLVAWGESHDNGFTLWDISNANLESLDLATLNPLVVPVAHNSVITKFAFSPDETMLASASQDGTAKLWRLSSEKPQLLMVLSGRTQGLNDVTFSPDGNQLATASQDGTVRLWDITPGGASEWFAFAGHTDDVFHIALTKDGKYLATASADGSARLWDLATKREILAITEHGSPLYSVAISADGTLLATAGYDNIAKLWKLELSPEDATAKLLHTLSGHGDGQSIGDEAFPGLTSVEFSPDSTKLATGGVGGLAEIWDVSTGQELLSIQIHPDRFGIISLAFSPDGKYLAAASDNTALKLQDFLANIWDATSGEEILTISDQRSFDYVWDLTFSPDGRRVATGSRNGKLRIWSTKTGEELLNLPGHGQRIFSVNFSRDGEYLVTASTDGTIKVWDAHSGKELRVYSSQNGQFFDATFTPDGKYVIASGDGIVYGFVFDAQELIRLAESRLTRWFYLDECRQYLHVEKCPAR